MNLRSFTLRDLVDRNARLHGARTAFAFGAQRVTHAQYAGRAARLAAGLAGAGLGLGERVAILAPNGPEYVDLFGAAALLGAIVVPINWRLSAEEVAYVIEDTAPRVLIASPEFQALVPAAIVASMRCYTLGPAQGAWQSANGLYADGEAPAVDFADDAGFVIIHTAAVGGRPRGALLSHGGLIAASVQAQLAWGLAPDAVNIGVLPLFHVSGIGLMLAAQHAGGATLMLPRFDPLAVVRHIEEDGGNLICTFPPMLGALLDAAAGQGSALSKLRVVTGLDSPETIARLKAACPNAVFWSTYGQTETSGPVSLSPFDERPGCAGRPTALNTVRIVDDLDRPVEAGAIGEIVVRGPVVFRGYWRNDADNNQTFRNNWHHTGDMGRFDADGYLWYAGRSPAKELIKPGGENVYPAEVERAILEHPALAEAAVIGVPDTQWGEAVKAVCVLRAGQSLAAEELIEFVGRRIARYKKPRHVVFVPALPRTAGGQTDRAALKAAHGHEAPSNRG